MHSMDNSLKCESVPLRQCLVMSVLYGESHQLPARLFGAQVVNQVVVGVTGECPDLILYSSGTDFPLVHGPGVDINRVRIQLEYQSSWIGKAVHIECSGEELKKLYYLPPPG